MKTKTKKNVPMRMASVLLVATMLTACMTSGTFAKYTTSDDAADSARVAKFGVVVSADGTLYGEEYVLGTAASGANEIIAYSGSTNSGTVQVSTTGTNVVAPGTKNSTGLGFGVSGTPEVDVLLTGSVSSENIYLTSGEYGVMVENAYVTEANYEKDKYYTLTSGTYSLSSDDFATGTTYYELTDYVNLTSTYYPVVYTLTGADSNANLTYNTGTVTSNSLDAITSLLGTSGVVNATGKTYDANTNLSDATSGFGSAVLTWEWAYQNYTEANPSGDLDSFVDGVTYYTKSGDNYEAVTDTSSGPSSGTTYYTTTMYDGADTILGDLSAIANGTMGGVVVKYDSGESGYVVPTADVDSTKGDYYLKTSFGLSLTVTQVD